MRPFRRELTSMLAVAFAVRIILFTMVICSNSVYANPAARACPGPKIDTTSWQARSFKPAGIQIRLPGRYKEHSPAVRVGSASDVSYHAGPSDHIDIMIEVARDRDLHKNKIIQQPYYLDYTECIEKIGNRDVVIQSFREPNVIFTKGDWRPAYNVVAICFITDSRLLKIMSGFASRESQEEALAMLRTIKFAQ